MKINFNEITIEPLKSTFDIHDIEKRIQDLPFTVRDPIEQYSILHSYMICNGVGEVDYCRRERLKDAKKFPWTIIIHVNSNQSTIGIGFYASGQESSFVNTSNFVKWLLQTYSCKVTDDEGRDWTDKVKQKGPQVLFE